jgi:hypothetical protein
MKVKKSLIAALALGLAVPSIAVAKDKKGQRGMLESMQSVPCGAKERGVTGLGSVFASVGVEHVNSHEQLCPQYLLRTDEMEYHIRPVDSKHATVLPIGHEAEFKIKKDRLFLKMADGKEKPLPYQVVAMQPMNAGTTNGENKSAESKPDGTGYHPAENQPQPAPPNPPGKDAGNAVAGQAVVAPPPQ